ncbi:proprotein convertase subtilisin/kexin type 4 isoform X1 [Turdus rufiventris]|nr:proprotein convertase subtilisin/kexin type 4 isoform X1 [Turdus rufiventris]
MAARPRPGPALSLFPVLFVLLVVVATAPSSLAKPHVYLSSWAVRVAAGLRDAPALARRHGLLYLGQVLWFEQQTLKRRSKRSSSVVPTDPWFPKQWYMNNDIHPDLNILTAWSRGYTGLGVVLTVLDDGLEKDHPDLAANYVTTDLHHRCTDKHTGTSASAPLAAGMVALALEANPALTWRDLQHLIIRASKPAHLQAEDWAENGVGRRVSHYYGYGLLDAGLLVQEATTWAGTRPQEKCSVQVIQVPRDIGSRLTIVTDASACSKSIRSLEHVQVQLSLSYSRRGDLVVALSSPMGTTSTLVTVRPYDTSQDGYQDWTFMSTHFWDENPKGIWTLQLENKGDDSNTGLLTSFTLHLHGTDEDMPARRSAATTTDECLKRDEQGACEDCGSSLYTHHGSCLSYCPPHYYGRARSATLRDTTRVCASCHPSCYTCQGDSANNCTSCPSGRTFEGTTHSCHRPAQGSPSPLGLRRDLVAVTVLACSSLVLAGVLYPMYRRVLRSGKGVPCWPQAGRAE